MSAPTRTVGRKARLSAPAGMDAAKRLEYLRVVVRQDVVRVAKLVGLPEGEAPCAADYHDYGRFGIHRVLKALGRRDRSWAKGMDVLGLGHHRNHREIPERKILEDVHRVARLLNRPHDMPTTAEYREHGTYSISTLCNRLGERDQSWVSVAQTCGLRYRHSAAHPIRNEELVEEYRRICRLYDVKWGEWGIGQNVWEKHSPVSVNLPRIRFGSWAAFVTAAGYRPREAKRRGVKYAPEAQLYLNRAKRAAAPPEQRAAA